jgi:hypothetical protein
MSITQTVEIPPSRRLTIDVPKDVPVGQVVLTFTPTRFFESQSGAEPAETVKSFRGILKGRGISVERLRELQLEDKSLENTVDIRHELHH